MNSAVNEKEKKELVAKLIESRENIIVLLGMFKREQWNVEQELRLVTETKQKLDEALYKLTGNEFYRDS